MKHPSLKGLGVTVLSLSILPASSPAQTGAVEAVPRNASEETIIRMIQHLAELQETGASLPRPPAIRLEQRRRMLVQVDALLERYPKSAFRDRALILKLEAVADLARTRPDDLKRLLLLTERIDRSGAKGELASENAFHAIGAFVYGARYESMPDERRRIGTMERYEAFLEDFPASKRRPVIWASLIRNTLALNRIDRAEAELKKLQRQFPGHRATRRATGEVFRATAVGRAFSFVYTTPDGQTVQSKDYLGKVLLVHFWGSWSAKSMAGLAELVELHKKYGRRGLQLIGINVDTDRRRTAAALREYPMPWPQYFDEKGLENDLLVGAGVVDIPTIFLIDRGGVCRSTDPGKWLTELIEELLSEAPEAIPKAKPGAG